MDNEITVDESEVKSVTQLANSERLKNPHVFYDPEIKDYQVRKVLIAKKIYDTIRVELFKKEMSK